MKIAFLGDISFNDAYIGQYEQGADPFKGVRNLLKACDFVFGNLECLSEGNEGENELKKPRLKTKTEVLHFLTHLNISAVTLAHNHVYDNLKDGFERTLKFLASNHMAYLGAGLSPSDAARPLIIESDNVKICLLSYVHPDTNPNLPAACPVHLNLYGKQKITKEIMHQKKDGNLVILMLHWGGKFEGGLYPDRYQAEDAREFVEAGADLIIGHHSHTLQPARKISGIWVCYSLGNFCFADIHFDGKLRDMSRRRFRETVIPVVELTSNSKPSITWVPIRNESLAVSEESSVMRRFRRRNLLHRFMTGIPFLWYLYPIYFKGLAPIWLQFVRKDENFTLFQRVLGLNFKKIKTLLKF